MSGRAPPRGRAAYAHTTIVTTRWADNDAYGHVNNTVYYAWFDTAVNEWLIANGLLHVAAGDPIGLVVETGCRYFSEMAFPDMVTAGIRVGRLGSTSVRYELGLFRNDEEQAAAEGFFIHVYVDRHSRRPVELTDPLRQALRQLQA